MKSNYSRHFIIACICATAALGSKTAAARPGSNEAYGEQRLIAEIEAHGDGTAAQSDDITLAILVRTAANPRDAG